MMGLARENGFKTVVATRGDNGLALANELKPDAITLDLHLPVMDGWQVLDRLKRNPRTRHIPVNVISIVDRDRGATLGAFAYLEKPVDGDTLDAAFNHISTWLDRKVRRLLLVEADETARSALAAQLGEGAEDVDLVTVPTAEAALKKLSGANFDCLVIDLVPPENEAFALLEKVRADYESLPVIVYSSRDITPEQEARLKSYAESVIISSRSDDGSVFNPGSPGEPLIPPTISL